MRKAYKITTTQDETSDSFGVYSAESAGRAKTMLFNGMRDIYKGVSYAWIKSCRRAPEYDSLALKYGGCIAWKQGLECFEQDKGHWWDYKKEENYV